MAAADGFTLRRTWKYRLYPTGCQEAELERQLGVACDLYNAALEHRRRMWRDHHVSIGYREQSAQLTEARREVPELQGMNALAQHEVLRKLDRAFAAFFRRVKAGEKPGYPRFRAPVRYDSLTWAQYAHGVRIVDVGPRNGRVRLQGVGEVKFRAHRPIPAGAKLGQVTVRRLNGRWWLTIALQIPRSAAAREASSGPLGAGGDREVVGIDLGVHTFAALSTGELLEGAHVARNARRQLRRAQRKVTRRQRGSRSRKRAARELARAQERVAATRRHHHHSTARRLVDDHQVLALEDLRPANLTRSAKGTIDQPGTNVRQKAGLNREILDQGWGDFTARLEEKAEETGTTIVRVNPAGTSQTCPACNSPAPKTLSQRVHRCPGCGYTTDRDHAAAQVIAQRGHQKLEHERHGRVPGGGHATRRADETESSVAVKSNQPATASRDNTLDDDPESSRADRCVGARERPRRNGLGDGAESSQGIVVARVRTIPGRSALDDDRKSSHDQPRGDALGHTGRNGLGDGAESSARGRRSGRGRVYVSKESGETTS